MLDNIEFKIAQSEYFLEEMKGNEARPNEFLFNLSAFLGSVKSIMYFLEKQVKNTKNKKNKEWYYCGGRCEFYKNDDLRIILTMRDKDVHEQVDLKDTKKDVIIHLPVVGSFGQVITNDNWFFKGRPDKPLLELCENFLKKVKAVFEKIKNLEIS